MSKNRKKKIEEETWETARHIRGNWNGINPVTRIVENKKKKKPKYKQKEYED